MSYGFSSFALFRIYVLGFYVQCSILGDPISNGIDFFSLFGFSFYVGSCSGTILRIINYLIEFQCFLCFFVRDVWALYKNTFNSVQLLALYRLVLVAGLFYMHVYEMCLVCFCLCCFPLFRF